MIIHPEIVHIKLLILIIQAVYYFPPWFGKVILKQLLIIEQKASYHIIKNCFKFLII